MHSLRRLGLAVAAPTVCWQLWPRSVATASAAAVPPPASHGDYDVVVVGGGIVGLATAREITLRYPKMKVAVLEKASEVAAHQSGHNSGVLHGGIYYEQGTSMARLCVRGVRLMYEFCQKHNIPHQRCGKLIVASDESEYPTLEVLLERGNTNGVKGLKIISGEEVAAVEPSVKAYAALYSPNTGIADFGAVSRKLASQLEAAGQSVHLQFEVQSFTRLDQYRDNQPWIEIHGVEPGQKGPVKVVRARHVVTCAGLFSDRVAMLAGGDPEPRVVPFRGTYYQLKPGVAPLVKMNIYPVPTKGGIPVGVHFTPTVNERRGETIIIGPGACIAFSREGYKFFDYTLWDLWDMATQVGLWKFAMGNTKLALGEMYRDLNRRAFLRQAQKLIPSLTDDMVDDSFAGVMAQVLLRDGSTAKDFIFERKRMGGCVMHLRNAPSPAATASLAIAEEIVDIAAEDFSWGPRELVHPPDDKPITEETAMEQW